MKNSLLVSFSFALIFLVSCIEDGIRPSGDATTITFEYDDFHTLNVSDAFNVEVVYDTIDPHVSITVDYNLLSHLQVSQQEGVLSIGLEDNVYVRGRTLETATVYTANTLTDIKGSGASVITISEPMMASDLDIDLSGASRIDAEVYLSNLSVDLSGASTAALSGEASLYLLEASGASTARGYNLQTNQLIVELSGASTGMFSVEESIIAEASGASSIRYRGSAEVLRADLSGGSNLEKID